MEVISIVDGIITQLITGEYNLAGTLGTLNRRMGQVINLPMKSSLKYQTLVSPSDFEVPRAQGF